MNYSITTFRGVKQNLSPLNHTDGDLLVCQNLDSYPIGAKTKRCGYTTYLGTLPNRVNSLFSWQKPSTGDLFLYAASNNGLYHSIEGTGDWTISGNGTITSVIPGVGHASLDDYLIIGDGAGSTRHTTNGTSFTNTTLAPVGNKMCEFNQRIYIGGTNNYLYASELGSAAGWDTTTTNPSFSEPITGRGTISAVRNVNGEVLTTKSGGAMVHFDGYQKYQNPSSMGPISPWSMDEYNGIWFWINRDGMIAHDTYPKVISRPVQDLFYSNFGTGVSYSYLQSGPGVVYKDDYMVSVANITSQLVPETVNDMVIKYNVPSNEFSWYKYAVRPYAFHRFIDRSGNEQLLFGENNSGQVYIRSGTATSDNGTAITARMMGFLDFGDPKKEKIVKEVAALTSPGCGATLQIAMSNTLDLNSLNWHTFPDLHSGYTAYSPPKPLRGRYCFYRLTESSTDKPFTFYSLMFDIDPIGK